MAVDIHPSRPPGLPRKPPATTTTDGQANTVSKTMQGWGLMEYGSRNGGDLKITGGSGSERANDFKAYTASDGEAPAAGAKQSQEPPGHKVGKVARPGDEKANGEPG
jgi:hypothetical protein